MGDVVNAEYCPCTETGVWIVSQANTDQAVVWGKPASATLVRGPRSTQNILEFRELKASLIPLFSGHRF